MTFHGGRKVSHVPHISIDIRSGHAFPSVSLYKAYTTSHLFLYLRRCRQLHRRSPDLLLLRLPGHSHPRRSTWRSTTKRWASRNSGSATSSPRPARSWGGNNRPESKPKPSPTLSKVVNGCFRSLIGRKSFDLYRGGGFCREGRHWAGADGVGEDGGFLAADPPSPAWKAASFFCLCSFTYKVVFFFFVWNLCEFVSFVYMNWWIFLFFFL